MQLIRSEGDSPDIIVPVTQELAQNVDRHHSETAIRFDFQDRQNRFIQDRVPHVLGRVRICGNL